MRLEQEVAGVEEQVDVMALAANELVQRPGEHRRLSQLRQRLCVVLGSLFLQLAHELRPPGDERVAVDAEELVDGVVEGHRREYPGAPAGSATRPLMRFAS